MRRTALAIATVLAIGTTGSVGTSQAGVTSGGVSAAAVAHLVQPQAQAACRRARIGGRSKCIAAGQYCARRYERDYRRYGYSCRKRDRNGRYHLVRL